MKFFLRLILFHGICTHRFEQEIMGATAEAPKGPPPPSPANVVHPTSQAEPRPLFPPGPPHVSRGDTLVSFPDIKPRNRTKCLENGLV